MIESTGKNMTETWADLARLERRVLSTSVVLSVLLLIALALSFTHKTPLAMPLNFDKINPPIEAQLFEKPEQEQPHQAHLAAPKAAAKPVARTTEQVVSRVADQGVKSTSAPKEETTNVVTTGDPHPTNHGPIALSSPAPHLPEYLRKENLKTSVLIEFVIAADGNSKPNLLGSSGNDELDALAIQTAKSWRFSPSIVNGVPTASKVRLRINFTVD